eukprot:282115-Rhodomonas_salina.1
MPACLCAHARASVCSEGKGGGRAEAAHAAPQLAAGCHGPWAGEAQRQALIGVTAGAGRCLSAKAHVHVR